MKIIVSFRIDLQYFLLKHDIRDQSHFFPMCFHHSISHSNVQCVQHTASSVLRPGSAQGNTPKETPSLSGKTGDRQTCNRCCVYRFKKDTMNIDDRNVNYLNLYNKDPGECQNSSRCHPNILSQKHAFLGHKCKRIKERRTEKRADRGKMQVERPNSLSLQQLEQGLVLSKLKPALTMSLELQKKGMIWLVKNLPEPACYI